MRTKTYFRCKPVLLMIKQMQTCHSAQNAESILVQLKLNSVFKSLYKSRSKMLQFYKNY